MVQPYFPIGFHTGPGGDMTGIGDYWRALDGAGRRIFIKSVDNYGPIHEVAQLATASGVPHVAVFRLAATGPGGFDVPDYNISPYAAAMKHWSRTIDWLPPEFNRQFCWLEVINEVDKNRAEWMAEFAMEISILALASGYKIAMFGWSSGEPEPEHWRGPMMRDYLDFAGQNKDKVAIALHEYSLHDTDIRYNYPYRVGRYKQLIDACYEMGIAIPNILITEWGWQATTVPDPDTARPQILDVGEEYASFPQILGAGIWYLGPGFGGIAQKAVQLIPIVQEIAMEFEGVPHIPPPDPPPDPPPPGDVPYVVVVNLLPQDATISEKTQVLETVHDAKETMLQSADDAARLVAPGKPGSKVKSWWSDRWGGDIEDWLKQKGVEVVEHHPKVYKHPLDGLKLGAPFRVPFTLTSWFNAPRDYDGDGVYDDKHEGTDYDVLAAGPSVEPVLCLYPGTVTRAGNSGGSYGLRVVVKHHYNDITFYTWYCHLDDIYVQVGDFVPRGGEIGELGGSGGFAEHVHINLQCPGYGLTGYVVPDVLDPGPFVSMTPEPNPFNALLGLHASADSVFAAGEFQLFETMKPEIIKILSSQHPVDVSQLASRYKTVPFVVRAFLSHPSDEVLTPQEFVNRTLPDLQRTITHMRNAGHSGEIYVEIHNEPNLKQEGLGKSWKDGYEFAIFADSVAKLYNETVSDVQFAYPGLSPGGDVSGIRADSLRFLAESRGFLGFDFDNSVMKVLCLHGYWSHAWPMSLTLSQIAAHRNLFTGRKAIITEASNNRRETSQAEKAVEYINFAKELGRIGVFGVTYFISSASNPTWGWGQGGSGEVWLGTEIPGIVGSR